MTFSDYRWHPRCSACGMQRNRVLVCGGGLAGLVAAHELARARMDVTLVEARHRLGGRMWTVRQGFAGGQHGELGGEFIDAGHEHMHALAERFHLELVPVLQGGFTHRFTSASRRIEVSRTRPWEALRESVTTLIQRYTEADGDVSADAVRDIARRSLRQWLDERGADADLYAMAKAIRGFFLADAEELSVLQVVEQLADGEFPSHIQMFRIAGGTDRLITALARETGARTMLGHMVRRINRLPDRIVAHLTDDRGGLHELEADSAVLALPASTLRHVEFVPALPHAQRRAVGAVTYGRSTKVAVQTTSPALRVRRARAFATDTALGAFWDASEGQPSHSHSVVHFLAGGSASPQLQRRVREGANGLLGDLCWLGVAGASVSASHSVTWEDDPLAGGGYAFGSPDFDPAWRPLLSRRSDRVVFAGEHTSDDYQGYMEGAVRSGMRAAGEILQTR